MAVTSSVTPSVQAMEAMAVTPSVTPSGQAMAVNIVKFFHDAVMTHTVPKVLSEAYEYCQVTFALTPLGGAVPLREPSAVRDELTKRKKVRKNADINKNKKPSI